MAANINLLPEVRVVKIKASQKKKLATTVTIMTGIIVGAIIVGLVLAIGFYAGQSKIRQSEAEGLQREVDSHKDVEQSATTLQEHLKSFTELNGKRIAGQNLFSQLVKVIPPTVTLQSLNLTQDNKAVVAGQTTDYKTLGTFAKALEEYNVNFKPQANAGSPIFTNVSITQSAKDAKTGLVSFSISFDVAKEILIVNSNIGS